MYRRPGLTRGWVTIAAVVLASVGAWGATAIASAGSGSGAPGIRPARIGRQHLVQIKIISTRADLVSGGEALVQVVLPPGAARSRIKLTLGRRDVSRQFAMRPNGKFEGLVTGLGVGANVLTARLPDGYGARIRITNHCHGRVSGKRGRHRCADLNRLQQPLYPQPARAARRGHLHRFPGGAADEGLGHRGLCRQAPFRQVGLGRAHDPPGVQLPRPLVVHLGRAPEGEYLGINLGFCHHSVAQPLFQALDLGLQVGLILLGCVVFSVL